MYNINIPFNTKSYLLILFKELVSELCDQLQEGDLWRRRRRVLIVLVNSIDYPKTVELCHCFAILDCVKSEG